MLDKAINKIKRLISVIDWDAFEKRENLLKSKVVAYCVDCNKPNHVTIDSLYRKSLKSNSYICPKCGAIKAINRPEVKAKIKSGNAKRAKSKEFRQALSEGQKKRFEDPGQKQSMSDN